MDPDHDPWADDPPEEPPEVVAERDEYARWVETIEPGIVDLVPGPPDLEPANGNGTGAAHALTPRQELDSVLLRGPAILEIPPPEPLIAGWLNLNSLVVLYGGPGAGKSMVALDMGLCVSTKSWWHGHETTPGRVLYVIAEGVSGVGPRVAAWAELNHVTVTDDMIWLPRAVNLLSRDWGEALADIAADLQPQLVIVDTLNRSMPGGEENSSKDMGVIIESCDRIRRRSGACVMLLHHSGKDPAQGARGHSSLLGAVDTELELKNGGDNILRLANTKQKDAAQALPLRLTLAPAADSVAVARYTGRIADDQEITPTGRLCLEALYRIATPAGISNTVWKDAAMEAGASRTQFYEQVKKLAELGDIVNNGTPKMPLWVPRDVAEPPP